MTSEGHLTSVSGALPALANVPAMDELLPDELMAEIERYLAAVALFRSLGHEPSWAPERDVEPCDRRGWREA